MRRIIRNMALVLAASWLFFGAAAQAAEPIRIGTFLSVTGPASFLGDPELKTLQMYIADINNRGGVLGRKLELVHYDVQHLADKARTAVKRLLEDDKVDIIVGGSTTGTTMAVAPLVEKAGVPFISLAGAV
ncbi:MAG: ABC transporter substrate-binding protein, partial [Gammaproteobacteria bacterium]